MFGIKEMDDVRLYGSINRVDIDQASGMATLKGYPDQKELYREKGFTTWPEYMMVVGGGSSNIVLDNLHIHNVVIKRMNVIYGGGKAILDRVIFVDCTFSLVKGPGAVQLSESLLQRTEVSFTS